MGNNVGMSGGGGGQIVEVVEMKASTPPPPPRTAVREDVVFVALGKKLKESKTVLGYAIHNSKARGLGICILHVHQPAQKMPMLGSKVPINMLQEAQVKAHHDNERKEMHKILDEYIQICKLATVQAEKLWIEVECIEKGIVQVISDHGVKWLVMGAASDKSYSRKMTWIKSKKAIHVYQEAPSFCHIWFVCKGNLMHTREGSLVRVNAIEDCNSHRASSSTENTEFSLRSFSTNEGQMLKPHGSVPGRRFLSEDHVSPPSTLSTGSGWATSPSAPEDSINWDYVSRKHTSFGSCVSSLHSEAIVDSASIHSTQRKVGTETEFELPEFRHIDSHAVSHTTSLVPEDENIDDQLYGKLEQYMAEAERSQRALHLESIRRQKAEKDAIDAILRAKAFEALYNQELRRAEEKEHSLALVREECEKLRSQVRKVEDELRVAQEQRSSLMNRIAKDDEMLEELEEKMASGVGMLQAYKREKLQLKRAE